MSGSSLEDLPVDHAWAPGAEPTLMERLDALLAELIASKDALIVVVCVVLFLALKRAVTSFTDVRVRQREARRRLEMEREDAIAAEMARLRAERDSAASR